MKAPALDPCSSSISMPEDEKVIPFLRRLTDMLKENENVISFYSGGEATGPALGQIVVHDRAKVEAEVLPRYFNHASFASLRRQLNYFNFARVGKGRQRGATYCNGNVVKLEDILRLKRRVVGSSTSTVTSHLSESYRDDVDITPPLSTSTIKTGLTSVERSMSMKDSKDTSVGKYIHHSEIEFKNINVEKNIELSRNIHFPRNRRLPRKKRVRRSLNSIVPFVHLPPSKKRRLEANTLINSSPVNLEALGILAKKSSTRSQHFKSKEKSENMIIRQLLPPSLESMIGSVPLSPEITANQELRSVNAHVKTNKNLRTTNHFSIPSKISYQETCSAESESPNHVNISLPGASYYWKSNTMLIKHVHILFVNLLKSTLGMRILLHAMFFLP